MQTPVAGNIYGILEGSKQYVIPVYQRIYSWEKTQCERLWSDIVDIHKSKKSSHFIGTIVNISEKMAPIGIQEFMIIDGQQRLTTLSLLLLALRDYAKQNIQCELNSDEINENYLINKFKSGNDKYKLLLTQSDKEIFIKKIEGAPILDSSKSRILNNYDFFIEKIMKEEIKPLELFETIGRIQLVSITLEREYDDPQAIFESLNSTGMDLKDSDLIRNYLLMGLDSTNQTYIYNTSWRTIELLFDYENQSDLLDNFFRDYLTMKISRIPKKNEVYKEFRNYRDNCKLSINELCKDIYLFAKHYSNMFFCRSNDIILKALYQNIKAIRMEVAYPFLLKVHDDYDKGSITIEDLCEIIQLCISYVFRRAICDIPTNSLNKTFATMKNDINQDDYINSVKAFFVMLESYKEFPNNERFIRAFITRDIYNMSRCRYILTSLENWDNKSIISLENLTIEHIIPQNPQLSDEWIISLGNNWNEIHKKYLHTIGNLTLTAYNSEMSDSPFAQKLNMPGGFRESAMRLNKYIVMQSSWSEHQIAERATILGELAKKIWPYPSISDTELAPYYKQDNLQQYTFDSYDHINAYNKMLFEKINTRILNLGTSVKREFKKLYIAYKVETNFVDVVIQKARLQLSLNMKFSELIDPKCLCRDCTKIGKWGNGDVTVNLDSLEQLDDIMELIKQAFTMQEIELL